MEYIDLYNSLIILGAFIISIVLEMMILPRVIFIAKRKRLFDLPDKRKKHCEPIPRLGGISFTPIILLVSFFCLFVRFNFHLGQEEIFFHCIKETILLVCGLLLIYLLGAKDDLVGVNFKKKFIIQFIASLFIVGSGVYINNLHGLFGFHQIPDWVGVILSIGLIIFTTNAINLIDGADGLASGISAIALFVFGVMFAYLGLWIYAGLAFITLGVLIPFFYYNFFHRTRKIFMGDTGSLTLGYILSFMIIRLSITPIAKEVVPDGMFLLVLVALFIPLFDAFKVMVVRMAMGKGPFSPDRNHIHHKLIDLGLSKKRTVFLLLSTSLLLIAVNWVLLWFVNCNILLIADLAFGVLVNIVLYRKIRKRVSAVEKKAEEDNVLELDS